MTDHLGNVRAVVDITDTGEDVADVMELVLEQNDYRPFGERVDDERMEVDGENRYRFAGKEEQTFLNGVYSDFGARYHSSDIQRWTTPDPLSEKYYDLSPYAFCNNNPVNFVDPDGMDWYEDDAGNAMWIDCSIEVHVDSTGREWKNIGPEYLFFNGQYLFYFQQSKVYQYEAVSGRPDENGNFVYTKEQQGIPDVGPIPEGLYNVNTQEIQSYWKTNPINVILAPIHKGKFPGGSFAWGYYRVWIENPDIVNVYNYELKTLITRSGFSIHGGITPGSAGCIDLYKNANRFFRRLRKSLSDNIRLNVNYGTIPKFS